jgi:ectoine hydroxylase-related dioxygenase (phytanoyl-CoA dioxygenase family)
MVKEEPLFTDHAAAAFDRDGIVTVGLPSGVLELQRSFLDEVCVWLLHFAQLNTDPDNVLEDLASAARRDRDLVARLYTVSRRFVSAKRLASHEYFVNLARSLMKTELVSCCNFVSVRFDFPREAKYLSDVHQDFPYIQGSLDGITVWLPFSDVDVDMGPPSFLHGSHKWGVLKVQPSWIDGKEGEPYRIGDTDRIGQADFVKTGISRSEALVFHTLTVHRSEPNTSKKVRVSAQLRFDDLLDTRSFMKNYPEGMYLGQLPSKAYPEFVIGVEQG